MPETIFPDLFQIVVPLPKNPLKAVNCYVIKGDDRFLVVDTGMNQPACREAMDAGLKELNVDRTKTDYFITHLHSDHIGLVGYLASETSTIYFNRLEADMMRQTQAQGGFGRRMAKFARLAGFSDTELQQAFDGHPGMRNDPPDYDKMTLLDEGAKLTIGRYNFECVQTPGHSPGHLCLYDREKRLMLCGDHVLEQISPNISAWTMDDDALTDYLASLDKVRGLDVELALPGHRMLIRDFHGRIDQLKAHHRDRLDEIMEVVDGTPLIAYDVAARMKWDIKYDHWDEVGPMQKWFATGEAVAHLRLLETRNLIRRDLEDGRVVFSRV